ncbi:MAG: type II toxin-antitoxin system RelE/ParE family toxin [Elusimicrobia bacterium]|nr:type II toxin-antitoxin system RelE/ParE family toxin [Elusimicrobiota bacterium]
MKRRLVYLKRAETDLVQIYDYIRRDSPAHAADWLDALDKTLSRLADFPHSGAVPRDQRLTSRSYRVVIIGEYLAFYRLQGRRIEIHRVLHGRRRYSFLLP